ncbi:MAG TPA: hypothetical protein V6D26_25980 [Stenomitos sp.]
MFKLCPEVLKLFYRAEVASLVRVIAQQTATDLNKPLLICIIP